MSDMTWDVFRDKVTLQSCLLYVWVSNMCVCVACDLHVSYFNKCREWATKTRRVEVNPLLSFSFRILVISLFSLLLPPNLSAAQLTSLSIPLLLPEPTQPHCPHLFISLSDNTHSSFSVKSLSIFLIIRRTLFWLSVLCLYYGAYSFQILLYNYSNGI